MPYCRNCGKDVPEDAQFCPNCGTSVEVSTRPKLAYWSERFVAWLIDIILLGVFLSIARLLLGPSLWPSFSWIPIYVRWVPFLDIGLNNIIFFFYWLIMDGYYDQSIGKMIMKIKVTHLSGKPIDFIPAAIESLGKAFILPLDCIIGWFFFPRNKQRLFNYVSDTIVIKA